MLTPEDKKRIEAEEWKRIAEEQYRSEFRERLRKGNASPRQDENEHQPPRRTRPKLVAASVLALVLILLMTVVVANFARIRSHRTAISEPAASAVSHSAIGANPVVDSVIAETAAAQKAQNQAFFNRLAPGDSVKSPSIRYVPASQQIASGQVVVPARGNVHYAFTVEPAMRDPHVSGRFTASGGAGNDVMAALATETEFVNWINGHEARVFYGSTGKRTTDSFDVRLPPGSYEFAISNQFSAVSSKYVFLDLKLNYQRMETY